MRILEVKMKALFRWQNENYSHEIAFGNHSFREWWIGVYKNQQVIALHMLLKIDTNCILFLVFKPPAVIVSHYDVARSSFLIDAKLNFLYFMANFNLSCICKGWIKKLKLSMETLTQPTITAWPRAFTVPVIFHWYSEVSKSCAYQIFFVSTIATVILGSKDIRNKWHVGI